jgi:hypothetical protein
VTLFCVRMAKDEEWVGWNGRQALEIWRSDRGIEGARCQRARDD